MGSFQHHGWIHCFGGCCKIWTIDRSAGNGFAPGADTYRWSGDGDCRDHESGDDSVK